MLVSRTEEMRTIVAQLNTALTQIATTVADLSARLDALEKEKD